MLRVSLANTERTLEPPVSAEFAETRALLLARLRALPDGKGLDPFPRVEWPETGRNKLIGDFLASPEAASLPAEGSTRFSAELLVRYGADYDRGRPLRVSPTKIDVFLRGWLPRKTMLEPEDRAVPPAVLDAWVRWAAGRTGLPDSLRDSTLAFVRNHPAPSTASAPDDDARRAFADPSHPDHEMRKDWVGQPFDAARFDRDEVTQLLRRYS
jgi:hypothetical protein